MPYGKQSSSKHSSSGLAVARQRRGNTDNLIAAKPVRAMGLPAFLAAVFMPRHCFAVCYPTNAIRAGGCAKIDA